MAIATPKTNSRDTNIPDLHRKKKKSYKIYFLICILSMYHQYYQIGTVVNPTQL